MFGIFKKKKNKNSLVIRLLKNSNAIYRVK